MQSARCKRPALCPPCAVLPPPPMHHRSTCIGRQASACCRCLAQNTALSIVTLQAPFHQPARWAWHACGASHTRRRRRRHRSSRAHACTLRRAHACRASLAAFYPGTCTRRSWGPCSVLHLHLLPHAPSSSTDADHLLPGTRCGIPHFPTSQCLPTLQPSLIGTELELHACRGCGEGWEGGARAPCTRPMHARPARRRRHLCARPHMFSLPLPPPAQVTPRTAASHRCGPQATGASPRAGGDGGLLGRPRPAGPRRPPRRRRL